MPLIIDFLTVHLEGVYYTYEREIFHNDVESLFTPCPNL